MPRAGTTDNRRENGRDRDEDRWVWGCGGMVAKKGVGQHIVGRNAKTHLRYPERIRRRSYSSKPTPCSSSPSAQLEPRPSRTHVPDLPFPAQGPRDLKNNTTLWPPPPLPPPLLLPRIPPKMNSNRTTGSKMARGITGLFERMVGEVQPRQAG